MFLGTEECNLRYAYDFLRTNHVSKLVVVFEMELGIVSLWRNFPCMGNPVTSELVAQYMAFTTAEQKQVGVLVQEAPKILRSRLAAMVIPMRIQLQTTFSVIDRMFLARNIAIFTAACSTAKREAELTATIIQRIPRLPNSSGFMFNFKWVKTQRDGGDHISTIRYRDYYVALCPCTLSNH